MIQAPHIPFSVPCLRQGADPTVHLPTVSGRGGWEAVGTFTALAIQRRGTPLMCLPGLSSACRDYTPWHQAWGLESPKEHTAWWAGQQDSQHSKPQTLLTEPRPQPAAHHSLVSDPSLLCPHSLHSQPRQPPFSSLPSSPHPGACK